MKEVQAGCRRPPTGKARVSSFLFLAFPVPLRKRGWDRTVCSALETRGAMWKQGNNQGAAASPRGSTTSSSVFTPLTPPPSPHANFFPATSTSDIHILISPDLLASLLLFSRSVGDDA